MFSASLLNKKRMILLIRWLVVIALSYLIVFGSNAPETTWREAVFITLLFLSNIILILLPRGLFEKPLFDGLIVLADTGLIAYGINISNHAGVEFYLFYFLIIIMTTFGRDMRTIVANAFFASLIYGWFLYRSHTDLFNYPGLLLRIPFLFVMALFYGSLVENHKTSGMVSSLRAALGARDERTHQHSSRAERLAGKMGRRLGVSQIGIAKLRYLCLLHDVGKIGIPDSILNKPGPLTDQEFEAMKRHPLIGEKIILQVDELKELRSLVRHHHERFDGLGYPDGISGEGIPLEVRVFSIIDAFDAMTSERPYHQPRSQEAAVMEIKRSAGTRFDPKLVKIFSELVLEADEEKQTSVGWKRFFRFTSPS
jgi:HD-GYP domain-containing protein (c-di-GMP phosphodiesterase class II)